MYKGHSNIAADIMNDVLEKKEKSYNLRNYVHFTQRNIKSAYYGSETILSLGPKIQILLPECIKDSENVNNFKSKI